MCWTRWKHQILMNWLSLYLFRPPVLQLINYLWAFSLQNLPQIWSKFWWSISMMLIYIMEKNPYVNLSWSWIISNSIFMLPKGYWYLKDGSDIDAVLPRYMTYDKRYIIRRNDDNPLSLYYLCLSKLLTFHCGCIQTQLSYRRYERELSDRS